MVDVTTWKEHQSSGTLSSTSDSFTLMNLALYGYFYLLSVINTSDFGQKKITLHK